MFLMILFNKKIYQFHLIDYIKILAFYKMLEVSSKWNHYKLFDIYDLENSIFSIQKNQNIIR